MVMGFGLGLDLGLALMHPGSADFVAGWGNDCSG